MKFSYGLPSTLIKYSSDSSLSMSSMSTSDGMQVSPPTVRGTYGSFVQIATCLGIIVSLLIGTPVKDIDRWLEAFCFIPLHAS